jgi:hypothetical protein
MTYEAVHNSAEARDRTSRMYSVMYEGVNYTVGESTETWKDERFKHLNSTSLTISSGQSGLEIQISQPEYCLIRRENDDETDRTEIIPNPVDNPEQSVTMRDTDNGWQMSGAFNLRIFNGRPQNLFTIENSGRGRSKRKYNYIVDNGEIFFLSGTPLTEKEETTIRARVSRMVEQYTALLGAVNSQRPV